MRTTYRQFSSKLVTFQFAFIFCVFVAHMQTASAGLLSELNIQSVPTAKQVDVGFSPDGSAEANVLKVIGSAKSEIQMAAYEFTSKNVMNALINAKNRGCNVSVIFDEQTTLETKYGKESYQRKLVAFMAQSGIAVRLDGQHAIQHNKYLIVDNQHVETGSFNYTVAATKNNAENSIVLWNSPDLAKVYRGDWETHWAHSQKFPE